MDWYFGIEEEGKLLKSLFLPQHSTKPTISMNGIEEYAQ